MMKATIAFAILLIPGLLSASGQTGQVQMSGAKYAVYTNASTQTNPIAKAEAFEAYLQTYPSSGVKLDVLHQLMISYSQAQINDKALGTADRILQVKSDDLRAITFEVILRKQAADASTDPAVSNQASIRPPTMRL